MADIIAKAVVNLAKAGVEEASQRDSEVQAVDNQETDQELALGATIRSTLHVGSEDVPEITCRMVSRDIDMPWYHKKLRLPRGMGIARYSFVVIAAAAIASSISFTILPLSNPLHDHDMHGWWHCPLTCTLVWVPLSTLYIAELLDLLVLDSVGKHLRVIDLITIWAITAGTIDVIYTVFSFLILYPFPMVSLFEAPLAFLLCALYLYFYAIPRITRDMDPVEASGLMSKAFYVLGFYEWSLLQLQVLLILCGLLNHSEMDAWNAPIVAVSGELCNAFSAWLATKVDPRAEVLGMNVSMVTFGIVQAELAGSVGDMKFTILMLVANSLFLVIPVLEIVQFKIGNVEIGHMLVFKWQVITRFVKCEYPLLHDVHVHQIKQQIIEDRTELLAGETAEMFVPLAYMLCWIVMFIGPNAVAFAGVRSSEFGLHAPSDVHSFLVNLAIVVVFETASFLLVHILLKLYSPEGLLDEAQYFLERYGTVLASQSVFIIQSAIMHSMIACGIDYSLKFDYIAEQWPEKLVGRTVMGWLVGNGS